MRTFEAKYAGRCAGCDERIHPGQEVGYVEDELVHADCEAAAPVERKVEVCTSCWLTKPCGCEDAA